MVKSEMLSRSACDVQQNFERHVILNPPFPSISPAWNHSSFNSPTSSSLPNSTATYFGKGNLPHVIKILKGGSFPFSGILATFMKTSFPATHMTCTDRQDRHDVINNCRRLDKDPGWSLTLTRNAWWRKQELIPRGENREVWRREWLKRGCFPYNSRMVPASLQKGRRKLTVRTDWFCSTPLFCSALSIPYTKPIDQGTYLPPPNPLLSII